jgi:hypothetical protein
MPARNFRKCALITILSGTLRWELIPETDQVAFLPLGHVQTTDIFANCVEKISDKNIVD